MDMEGTAVSESRLAALIARVPVAVRLALTAFAIFLVFFLMFRLAFLLWYKPEGAALLSVPVARAFYVGSKFDARLAALLSFPVLCLWWLRPLDPREHRGRRAWLAYVLAVLATAVVFYVFDFGTYAYIGLRLNASLLTFMENPNISLGMILSTYPWVRLLLFFGAMLAGIGYGLRKLLPLLLRVPEVAPASRRTRFAAYGLTALAFAVAIYGKAQRFPLRWSDAFVQRDSFLCQFALNPILFFFETLREKPMNFDLEKARALYPVVASHLGKEPLEPDTLSLRREVRPRAKPERDWNVVVIFLETFAAFKVGAMGNPLPESPSPRFDELAREGLLFTRFYVPMENTSRSLFAAFFGIPDVSDRRSSSRNPLVVDQHTIVNCFTGYDKLYFLGGSANWGNIRGMLLHNIEGLELFEEGSYSSPVHDVWGISDADLFMEANAVLRTRSSKPFFAAIQTAGNHRPFKIPKNSRGFVPKNVELEVLKENGFYSLEEYNGFRFLDHCLGYFMDLARNEPYFERTLFVLLGDHGTGGGSKDRRFAGQSIPSVHVPLLFYAPGLVKPGRIDTVASELDLMPTIAGLLGKPYINTTLGRDLLDPNWRGTPCAFTFTPFARPPSIGLIEDNYYAILKGDGGKGLYRLDLEEEKNLLQEEPERAERMLRLAEGFYEMARYLLYHNKKEQARPATSPARP